MAATPPVCDFGWPAPALALPDTTGRVWTLADIRGTQGTLIAFICNHCPYVQAILDRLIRDASALQGLGVGVAAICSNDADSYPEDAPDQMAALARARGFPFPYLHDADQSVARRYGAVCTPDFFGFDAGLGLQYRGRLDASRAQPAPPGVRRELYEAMRQIAETGCGPADQVPSMGCSINWKTT